MLIESGAVVEDMYSYIPTDRKMPRPDTKIQGRGSSNSLASTGESRRWTFLHPGRFVSPLDTHVLKETSPWDRPP